MSTLDEPMGKKRALLVAVRHVRGLPNFHTTGFADLSWAHLDAINLRDRLIASHGYEAKDVILMLDDQRHPEDLWPTRKNILREIYRLVSDAPEDSQFFLYYSGHGLQKECQDGEEADGKDEEIVAADGRPILDDLLQFHLISPLKRVKGSKLFVRTPDDERFVY
ncbi:hypothetical protein BS17DRAFT_777774 [Gyrodon lividus]|nr:hypothetical protein BS17DRAFT_777774 [Gyrodon lividus]